LAGFSILIIEEKKAGKLPINWSGKELIYDATRVNVEYS